MAMITSPVGDRSATKSEPRPYLSPVLAPASNVHCDRDATLGDIRQHTRQAPLFLGLVAQPTLAGRRRAASSTRASAAPGRSGRAKPSPNRPATIAASPGSSADGRSTASARYAAEGVRGPGVYWQGRSAQISRWSEQGAWWKGQEGRNVDLRWAADPTTGPSTRDRVPTRWGSRRGKGWPSEWNNVEEAWNNRQHGRRPRPGHDFAEAREQLPRPARN